MTAWKIIITVRDICTVLSIVLGERRQDHADDHRTGVRRHRIGPVPSSRESPRSESFSPLPDTTSSTGLQPQPGLGVRMALINSDAGLPHRLGEATSHLRG